MTRRLAGALTMLILLAGFLALTANAAEPEGATTELPTIGKWLEDHGLGPRAVVLVIAMLPIIELRGALPVAILYYKMPVLEAFIFSVVGNLLPIIPIILIIGPLGEFLAGRYQFWHRLFHWMTERAKRKGADLVEKYEALGLSIFVGIPLPVTGAWTGSLLAFILRMGARRAFLALLAGVLAAGVIVTLVTLFGRESFRFLIKA